MRRVKTILNLVADLYLAGNPHFFYQQVIYFPDTTTMQRTSSFINQSDIFVDQIDIKLIEEEEESTLTKTSACFFFKS